MLNTACLIGPPFSLSGNTSFTNGQVSFALSFDSEGDQSEVMAYEWYLDDYLVINQNEPGFAYDISCGNHTIGARILTAEGWTGIRSLAFQTCRTLLSTAISGPDTVAQGSTAAYQVLEHYSDGSSADVTDNYVFSSPDGQFSGGTFTPHTDFRDTHDAEITATRTGDPVLTLPVTITSEGGYAGVLVVDLYDATGLDVIGLVLNGVVADSNVAAFTGQNTVPTASAPADALILASDAVAQPTLNWRFEFNIARLLAAYPGQPEFVFQVKGRGVTAKTVSGAFVLKNYASQMTLTGTPGNYIPSVTGSDLGEWVFYTSGAEGGADGSHAPGDLRTLIELTYHVASKTITYTTHTAEIPVTDFDFMTVRYHWDAAGGTDLDILVGYENNQTLYQNVYVGFGQPDATVPAATMPAADAYLWWGLDNRTNTGYEAVLVGVKKFIQDFPALPDVVEAGIYAIWYGQPASGSFTVDLVTYLGGSMSLSGTDFINTGGTQISTNSINVSTQVHNTLHTAANAYKVGTLKYTRSTQTAMIEIY